jgi:hypothetical protein
VTGAEVQEFAGMIRAVHLGKWWFDGDPEDLTQDAAFHTLKEQRKSRKPLKGNRGYYFAVATREARLDWNRARATVTMGERALRRSSEYSDRTPMVGCGGRAEDGAVDLEDDRQPDAGRRRRDAAGARAHLLGILEDHAEMLHPTERQVVAMLLGLGTQLRQMDPEEVYAATGLAAASVWAIVRRFGKRVRSDRGALRARRAYLSHQEAA